MSEELSKIDTQGMSGGPAKGGSASRGNKYPVDPVTGKTIYPPMMVKPRRLFEDTFVNLS